MVGCAQRNAMRKLLFAILMILLAHTPAGASSLVDDEDANDSIDTAGIQIPRERDPSAYVGEFNLGPNDVDFVGLGPLVEGDVITAISTPLEDGFFNFPDTAFGVFDAAGDLLLFNDDAGNEGFGSGLRFRVEEDGAHFLGVTGWEDEGFMGFHEEEGDYALTISVLPVPLPNSPPDCSTAIADPDQLRSPNRRAEPNVHALSSMFQGIFSRNRKMVDVSVNGVADPDEDPVDLTITSIFQDEPVQNSRRRNACGDGAGVGTATASVRAKSFGTGDGRVYTIGFDASDGNDGECSGTVTVCVPHDRRRNNTCVNQGPLFDSTNCDL
jgi:hypothetical protein